MSKVDYMKRNIFCLETVCVSRYIVSVQGQLSAGKVNNIVSNFEKDTNFQAFDL